jgi:hypothetical protein
MAGRCVAARPASQGQDGDSDADRRGRDGAGDEDPARVPKLAPGRIADRRDKVLERTVPGQPGPEAGLEARAGRERPERRADR